MYNKYTGSNKLLGSNAIYLSYRQSISFDGKETNQTLCTMSIFKIRLKLFSSCYNVGCCG